MAYESGAIGDDMLRAMAGKVLAGRVGWEFWREVRDIRLSTAASGRARRFHRLIDEEFQSLPEPHSIATSEREPAPGPRTVHWMLLGGVIGAALASAAAGWRARTAREDVHGHLERRRRKPPRR